MFTKLALAGALAAALAACGPDPIAPNRAMTQGVIERAGAQRVFVDASTAEQARVRHRPSGLVCAIPTDGAFQIETFPEGATNEGVACTRSVDGVATNLMAMKFNHEVSLDQAFAESVNMSARLEGAAGWVGAESPADAEHGDIDRIVRVRGRANGEEVYLRVAMVQSRDWFVQQIVFAPIDKAEAAEAVAGEDWRLVLSQTTR